MEELRHLDEVAYVRFASVYRSFQDVEAFHEEIERLRNARQRRERRPAHAASARPARANRDQLPLLPTDEPPADKRGGNKQMSSTGAPCSLTSTASPCTARWRWRRAACTAPIRIRAWAACSRAASAVVGEGWHERAGEAHAEVAALRAAGAAGRRRHRLRDARAVQPPRPHAAVHAGADRGARGARGVRHRRPQPAGQRARRRGAARGRHARSSRGCWKPRRAS